MQVNFQNIQRPQLFSDFLNLELMWNNEYLTYIDISIHKITKNVTSTIDNIKNILNTKIYQFDNFDDFIQNSINFDYPHINLGFKKEDLVFINSKGVLVKSDKDFKRAKKYDLYPIVAMIYIQ